MKTVALAASLLAFTRALAADPIVVKAVPLTFAEEDSQGAGLGPLRYRGGLALSSDDPRFGGLSAMHVTPDGKHMSAISDEGHWFTARLVYDERGWLAGIADAEIGFLLGVDGRRLAGKRESDAESMTMMPDGVIIVGFEHHHRLLVFRGKQPLKSVPYEFTPPPDLERAPVNESLESLASFKDGGLFAVTEDMMERGLLRAWLWRSGAWSILHYRPIGAPRPSDATTLPSGDVLVLERSFTPILGLSLRLRRIAADTLRPGAVLDPEVLAELKPPLPVDNFEGLAARLGNKGETQLYVISDDNFSRLQRTLLLMFALPSEGPATGEGGR